MSDEIETLLPNYPLAPYYPWQAKHWQVFANLYASERFPHAVLLAGFAGTGKDYFAHQLAGLLLCHQPQSGQACGVCHACHLLLAGHHPDYVWVKPEHSGKAIKIDPIRSLASLLLKTAQQGRHKVVVIEPAEALNRMAANALLKILEEPPAHSVIILISHQPGLLLPTVRSRCQTHLMALPDKQLALHWLQEQTQLPVEQLQLLLQLSHGAPTAALALAQDSNWQQQREQIIQHFDALASQRIPAFDTGVIAKLDFTEVLTFLLAWVIDLQRLAVRNENPDIANSDQHALLNRQLMALDLNELFRYYDYLIGLKRQIFSQANFNWTLCLEDLQIRWVKLFIPADKINNGRKL